MPRFRAVALCLGIVALAGPVLGQTAGEEAQALAVADSVLAAITRGDFVAMTDLMLDEAVAFPSSTRNGQFAYRVRTRAEQRAAKASGIVERGYSPEVRVQGPIAIVWYPYDLYIDGKWSHCGIDVFTLLRAGGRWRVATMAWSAEQPPVCSAHPDGPPKP